jgi:hypothetical protein
MTQTDQLGATRSQSSLNAMLAKELGVVLATDVELPAGGKLDFAWPPVARRCARHNSAR